MPSHSDLPWAYGAFGLHIRSEVELPGLPSAPPAAPDLCVRTGGVPGAVVSERSGDVIAGAHGAGFRMDVAGVGSYWAGAREVRAASASGADPAAFRSYILSSMMAVVTHLRGTIPLHASAVRTPWGACLLTGEAGSGKSTLAVALHRAGWPFLADDLVVLSLRESGPPTAHPGSTEVRLWSDALGPLELSDAEPTPIPGRAGKNRVSLPHGVERAPVPLHSIVELVSSGPAAPQPVFGSEKVGVLLRNTYRMRIMKSLGGQVGHFDRISRMAPTVPIFQLGRATTAEGIRGPVEELQHFLAGPQEPSFR